MTQDFSKKIVIAVRTDIALWQQVNAVAHSSAYIGNKMKDVFDTGEFFVTHDGINLPRNGQFAIVALSATKDQLRELAMKARECDLLMIEFVKQMINITDDTQIENWIMEKDYADVEPLAVGLFGTKDELRSLTKHLKLWQ